MVSKKQAKELLKREVEELRENRPLRTWMRSLLKTGSFINQAEIWV
jgi:hypothetical protein